MHMCIDLYVSEQITNRMAKYFSSTYFVCFVITGTSGMYERKNNYYWARNLESIIFPTIFYLDVL